MRAYETICNPIEQVLYFLSVLCFVMAIMPINQTVIFRLVIFDFKLVIWDCDELGLPQIIRLKSKITHLKQTLRLTDIISVYVKKHWQKTKILQTITLTCSREVITCTVILCTGNGTMLNQQLQHIGVHSRQTTIEQKAAEHPRSPT